MRLRRILSLHLNSSSLFAFGTALPAISYFIVFFTKNSLNDVLVEFFSGAFFTCHVLPEIIIDLNTFPKAKRKLPHMRYGTGPCTNFVQSILFAASCIFQGIFFASTWSDDDFHNKDEAEIEAYEILNLIAGHIWLLSGLVSICSVGSAVPICRRPEGNAGFWERVANDVYVWTTVTLFVAGYVMILNRHAGHIMHVIVRGIWCVLGSFYFMNDLIEEYIYRSNAGSVKDDDYLRKRLGQKQPLVDEDES